LLRQNPNRRAAGNQASRATGARPERPTHTAEIRSFQLPQQKEAAAAAGPERCEQFARWGRSGPVLAAGQLRQRRSPRWPSKGRVDRGPRWQAWIARGDQNCDNAPNVRPARPPIVGVRRPCCDGPGAPSLRSPGRALEGPQIRRTPQRARPPLTKPATSRGGVTGCATTVGPSASEDAKNKPRANQPPATVHVGTRAGLGALCLGNANRAESSQFSSVWLVARYSSSSANQRLKKFSCPFPPVLYHRERRPLHRHQRPLVCQPAEQVGSCAGSNRGRASSRGSG